jgi:hypothetical protein
MPPGPMNEPPLIRALSGILADALPGWITQKDYGNRTIMTFDEPITMRLEYLASTQSAVPFANCLFRTFEPASLIGGKESSERPQLLWVELAQTFISHFIRTSYKLERPF